MLVGHYAELLSYYRRLILLIWLGIVGGVVCLSVLFLHVSPLYKATSKVSLLPSQSELNFSQAFVRGSSVNPTNLLTQTHIEYLLSFETSQATVDRLTEETGGVVTEAPTGLKAVVSDAFRNFRRTFRQYYNILNSGKHVPLDPYTDTILNLQDSIDVEMVEGTYILEIAVTWNDPDIAAAAANTLADVYIERARSETEAASLALEQQLLAEATRGNTPLGGPETQLNSLRLARAADINALRVIDAAATPIYPSFPKVVVNTVLAIVGAVAFSVFALVAADTFSNTIKTRADVARLMSGRALPTIRLRRDGSPVLAKRSLSEAAKYLRLRTDANLQTGAVLSLGTDVQSEAAAKFVQEALRGDLGGRGRSNAPLVLSNSDLSETSTDWVPEKRVAMVGSAEVAEAVMPSFLPSVHEQERSARRAKRWPNRLNLKTSRPEGSITSLGGAMQSYSPDGLESPNWLVIAIRPGEITEPEITGMIDELKRRDIGAVFGMLLVG